MWRVLLADVVWSICGAVCSFECYGLLFVGDWGCYCRCRCVCGASPVRCVVFMCILDVTSVSCVWLYLMEVWFFLTVLSQVHVTGMCDSTPSTFVRSRPSHPTRSNGRLVLPITTSDYFRSRQEGFVLFSYGSSKCTWFDLAQTGVPYSSIE